MMQIPVEKWYPAIFERRSRRTFEAKPIPLDMIEHLQKVAGELNEEIPSARAVLVTGNPDDVFKGAVGTYGQIKNAPAYAAFIGSMKQRNVQEEVGRLGEFFILEATALGLATCWVGGFFKPDVVQAQIALQPDEQVLAVSPVGFTKTQYTLEEKLMSGLVASRKRKNLEQLYTGKSLKTIPSWVSSALEAARLAPSAVNRQPWRFALAEGGLRVSVDKLKDSYHISKRLDCGIAMAHIEIAALREGIAGHWGFLPGPDVGLFIQE